MQPGLYSAITTSLHVAVILNSAFIPFCLSAPSDASLVISVRNNNPLNIDWDPAPAPEDGPPLSAGALRDPAYLPAQIGGIVGAYALSLVLVAATLLLLAKKRRQHLEAADEDFEELKYDLAFPEGFPQSPEDPFPYSLTTPRSPIKNFSYPTPVEQEPNPYVFPSPQEPNPYIIPSPQSSTLALGVNPLVDQNVVAADREMAQQQLEEMYKYVMEQDEAKQAGVVLQAPPAPMLKSPPTPSSQKSGFLRKGKNKPANLELNNPEMEKPQSRTSSILSALKSPRGKKPSVKGISISSPIMTPMSGTFPRQEGEEMETIPPRHYAPAPPPPVPSDQYPYMARRMTRPVEPLTPPDMSPESTMSIDERLGYEFGHARNTSEAPTEGEPVSAISERSTTPLVGLPSSPKPSVTRFQIPSLPSSPKPGATFQRANAPSAVRTGGSLPLRAYEPSLVSPSFQTTKQTTFERAPLSPGLRTPMTGAAVPYSPYQPFTPVVPMTPSLVTKADRKRMKQLQPKTPTLQMVKSADDIW
ncbi:hypothetical protein BKA67DRAFT_539499 [Truncatella angustata]|uniref:Uncharacterized protein n=1 Tax=Truncatella angustata TaxID=152316 RepID=A0A9P8RKC2_9PEZI|nr:uncharacterized protein BKA67DRAFT_539499 [Truncatella angustata]KAH6647650.1 hypothetical protein BKA67DRAFT_539499 [Truncatella angustata]KAH8204322.1 hypothetical protein TruAng_001485 [Truncatella angustata]